MGKTNRIELGSEVLESVNGGAIGFNPDNNGTYTMLCEFTGNRYYGIRLDQVIEVAKYAAAIPNTLEGEQNILAWAQEQGII